jgi:hypothetical protein
MLEQANVEKRELRILFSDYRRAFDAVDRTTGKLLAKMRFGISQEVALRERQRDEAIEGEIEIAPGLCSSFTNSRLKRAAGWSQGSARAGPEWKRNIDVNICAHAEPHKGVPAIYHDEWGNAVEYVGHWYADDPTIFCGDTENVEARVKTDVDWSHFSGVSIAAHKGHYLVNNFDENGKRIEIDEHTVHIKDCQTGESKEIPHLEVDEPVRTLGHFMACSNATDQSFATELPVCNTECKILLGKQLTADEFASVINVCTIPRIKMRFCYATSSDKSLKKLQQKYKDHLKKLAHLPCSFPNNILFGATERGGIGISSFADEVNVSRVVAFLQHVRGNDIERELACAAVKTSEKLTQGDIPVLERRGPAPFEQEWDQTWMGRIGDFCTDKGFAITGGQRNRGIREGDITIMSLFNTVDKSTYRKLSAGCRHYSLHWVSQLLSDDSSTFRTEFQDYRQEFGGKYEVKWFTEDCFGGRVQRLGTATGQAWLDMVKKAAVKYKDVCKFGRFHNECLSEIQLCDVVVIAGDKDLKPKIVIEVDCEKNKIKVISTSPNNRLTMSKIPHVDAIARRWVSCGLRTTMSEEIYSIGDDDEMEVHELKGAIKIETQFLPRKSRTTVFFPIRREDLFSGDTDEIMNAGIYFRPAIDREWFHLQKTRPEPIALEQFYLNEQVESYEHVIGEENLMPHLPKVEDLIDDLREQCKMFKKGAVLTGGDASGTRAHTESRSAHCFIVFGVGESDPWWWEKKAATDVEVLACGGSIDWIEPLRQNSARSEIICVLTVLLRFRGLDVNVLHSTDYLYARDTVQNVQSWSAAQWCACSNRDLWESIAFLLDEYESAGTSFRVFHNKAHPEDWQDDMFQYTALEQVAHVTDALVGVVKGVVEVRPDVPVLPGRNRWKLWHNNMEITGPISASMQSINRLSYIAQHFATSRNGTIGGLDPLTFWPAVEGGLKSNKTLTSRVSVAKFLYQWWATNAKLAQRKHVDIDDENGDLCECGEVETAYHLMCECKLKRYVDVRQAFAQRRAKMISSSPYSPAVKNKFSEIHEIKDDGTYPDLSSESELWLTDESTTATEAEMISIYKEAGNCPLPWFNKGPLPAGLVNSAASVLEVEYDDAHKFCKAWFKSALDENLLIWRARNLEKHGDDLSDYKPWFNLRQDYFAAVRYLEKVGIELPDRAQVGSARREVMQQRIDQADDIRAGSSMLAHITVGGRSLTTEEQRARQQAQRDARRS